MEAEVEGAVEGNGGSARGKGIRADDAVGAGDRADDAVGAGDIVRGRAREEVVGAGERDGWSRPMVAALTLPTPPPRSEPAPSEGAVLLFNCVRAVCEPDK